jgi:CubicO group peptidase (beta-lactamase class C family)
MRRGIASQTIGARVFPSRDGKILACLLVALLIQTFGTALAAPIVAKSAPIAEPARKPATAPAIGLAARPVAKPTTEPTVAPAIQPASDRKIENLDAFLSPLREEHDVPALAAAVVRADGLIATGAVGVRKAGSEEKVTLEDRWQIGSCTKSMTATVAAVLVDQGKLSWDSTLAEVFPDLRDEMQPAYRDVTLAQLLAHRSGLAEDREPIPWLMLKMRAMSGPPMKQRQEFLKLILAREPAAEPGKEFQYSNFGYTIAGAMTERVTGKSWEELLDNLLLEPLRITSAGIGAPGSADKVDQPWGHRRLGARWMPMPPGPLADNPVVISPAGCVHFTIGDWAKYAAFHLRGARSEGEILKPETFRRLHLDVRSQGYALGWGVRHEPDLGGTVLTHAGSNTMWFAIIWIAPNANVAVVVATNTGNDNGGRACRSAADKLVHLYARVEETPLTPAPTQPVGPPSP